MAYFAWLVDFAEVTLSTFNILWILKYIFSDFIHWNAACAGNDGEAGDFTAQGTCNDGKVCSPTGNCEGKTL